ncbi:Lactonase, 7-bladed beta-propeller-domain-containing protein [Hysterangium stoloniferum]|nr:Lactonase, 7-bladed beta-propeller-domain-containing protein [Hysterangium stoloniferum]
MSRKILVASYSSHVDTLEFDATASPPTLRLVSKLEVGHHPSWITPHKTDPSIVFTAPEQADGLIKALQYDLTTGVGQVVAEASSGGAEPCHLAISGNDLLAANYSGGSIGVLQLSSSAPYLPSRPSQIISFKGTGPIKSRQEASHPHQVLVHPTTKEVLIPDLGADKLWRLRNRGDEWVTLGSIETPPGGGPRHGVILGSNSPPLTSPLPGVPIALHSAPTLLNPPLNPTEIDPPPLPAEILCTPVSEVYPTHYLYVSNRNDPSPNGDVISIFEIGAEGVFTLINEVRTGLTHARGIAFDEEHKYLVAGGTSGNGVKIFERVAGGKNLKEIAYLRDVESPTGFHWLPLA